MSEIEIILVCYRTRGVCENRTNTTEIIPEFKF